MTINLAHEVLILGRERWNDTKTQLLQPVLYFDYLLPTCNVYLGTCWLSGVLL